MNIVNFRFNMPRAHGVMTITCRRNSVVVSYVPTHGEQMGALISVRRPWSVFVCIFETDNLTSPIVGNQFVSLL